jgi:hypothetical protein
MTTFARIAGVGVPRALAAAFCLAFLGCERNDLESAARNRLAQVLRDSLGQRSNPNVAFIVDGGRRDSHLYVMFDTTAVANASDSVFALRALDIARFSLRHYDKATELDSITIATRKSVERGVWRIQHTRTFPAYQARALANGDSILAPPDTR